MTNTTNIYTLPSNSLLDQHIDYLIALIPEDNVVYHFYHEIIYLDGTPSLNVIVDSHFPIPETPRNFELLIDPTNTTGSIHQLLQIRKEFGTPTS